MKKTIIFKLFLFVSVAMTAQVGINNVDPKATMDVTAMSTGATTAEGIIAPRLTGDQIQAKDAQYTVAQTGTLLYATAAVTAPSGKTVNMTSAGYYYFNGTAWIKIASPVAGADNTNDAWANNNVPGAKKIELATLADGTTARTAKTNVSIKDNGDLVLGSNQLYPGRRATIVSERATQEDEVGIVSFGNGTNPPFPAYTMSSAYGTEAAPIDLPNNAGIGAIAWDGYVNGSFQELSRIQVEYVENGANPKGFMNIYTGGGTAGANAGLSIDGNNNIGIGTTEPSELLQVGSRATINNTVKILSQGGNIGYSGIDLNVYDNSYGAKIQYNDQGSVGKEIGLHFKVSQGALSNTTASSMFIDANGNVGIGTTAPTSKLHVIAENASTDPLRLQGLRAGAAADQILSVDTNGVVRKVAASGAADTTNDAWVNDGTSVILQNTDGTPRPAGHDFIALDNGNVGIGTTAPSELLQVGSGATINTTLKIFSQGGNIGYSGIDLKVYNDLVGAKIQYNEKNSVGNEIGLHFKVSQGALSNTTASSMFIDGFNGNVGIGTTTPTNALDINSTNPLRLRGLQTGVAADQRLTVDSNGVVRTVAAGTTGNATNDAWVNNGTRVELGTLANGTSPRPASTQLVVLDNGNVGVGTITPTSKLQITGSFSAPIRSFAGQVLASDYTILGTGNVTLPSPVGVRGRIYMFVYDGTAFNIFVASGLKFRYDGVQKLVWNIDDFDQAVTVQSDGTDWVIIDENY